MTSAFSSNDLAVIERYIDPIADGQAIQEIWNVTRCSECLDWISRNNFKRVRNKACLKGERIIKMIFQVCLQFPDDLIKFSIEITEELSKLDECEVYVLGDTSYGSCCIDEVRNHQIHNYRFSNKTIEF